LSRFISPALLKTMAGAAFILIGFWVLFSRSA
jgi:hypothetical protein